MNRMFFGKVLTAAVCCFWGVYGTGGDPISPVESDGLKAGLWKPVPEPPKTPEVPAAQTYVIDLAKFGIKQGIPKKQDRLVDGKSVKCYSEDDYKQAYANMTGINRAIEAGADQGAKKVLLPKGDYSVCYAHISNNQKENCIYINSSNLIVDFGGSTLKVLYDSQVRSPYDRDFDRASKSFVPGKSPIYQFCGFVINVTDCENTTVRNGKIIGDKIDRSFKEQKEKAVESSYGIGAGANSRNLVVEQMDVSLFMGDGLTGSGRSMKRSGVRVGYQMGWKIGGLDSKGMEIQTKSQCVSGFFPITPSQSYFMQGYAYTQGMTAIKKRQYSVYEYDAKKQFIRSTPDVKTLRNVTTSPKTEFLRLVVDEPAIHKDGWLMQLMCGRYGSHITFRDNVTHHNHRGGMTLGVNDMLIIRNRFYNNGEYPDKDNNLPGFEQPSGVPFMTRYHINMEDSQGHNIHVVNNQFENGRLGLAVRGSEYYVAGNTFLNTGAIFYRLSNLVFKNNILRNGNIETFPYNADGGFVRNWVFDSNRIEGSIKITGNAPMKAILRNQITGGFRSEAPVELFQENQVSVERDAGYQPLLDLSSVRKIDRVKLSKSLESTVKNTIQIGNLKEKTAVRNCVFERIKVGVCNTEFESCTIVDSAFNVGSGVSFRNCTFQQGDYQVLNNYPGHPFNSALFFFDKGSDALLLDHCRIESKGKNPVFSSPGTGPSSVTVSLKHTNVRKTGTDLLGLNVIQGGLNLKDSVITSALKTPSTKCTPVLTGKSKITLP